ncbi:CLUMA_CG019413, isoform A [Clunio marinus]|uniref:CLUMA_CG019413, isoform A n=1 Tax=Clunio marinus TaxID=568069 RepID=A0A1J1J0K5_9DIPT|nr:CLUMA_CG019413, isoform A [Clunio marinus]
MNERKSDFESLCCYMEFAKVSHKGHDCKLKQVTPTVYYDCWQKCKALIAGNRTKRAELLEKLARGQQRSSGSYLNRKTPSTDAEGEWFMTMVTLSRDCSIADVCRTTT